MARVGMIHSAVPLPQRKFVKSVGLRLDPKENSSPTNKKLIQRFSERTLSGRERGTTAT
jgi:hypothetical protein